MALYHLVFGFKRKEHIAITYLNLQSNIINFESAFEFKLFIFN